MKTRRTVAKLFATALAMVVLLPSAPLYAQGKGGSQNPPPPPPPSLPTFTYQSLGTLGGATSTAEGINDLGEVVGNADLSNGSSVPYLYTPADGMRNLNVLTEGPMDYPQRTLFGPDGRFYVCNGSGTIGGLGSVAVFNPLTGDFIKMFVPVGSGGLENPADMTFGPNGDLYIPSHNGPGTSRNRILRFSGTTGIYLGEFVAYGAGGVNSITYLTFGPDVGGGPNGEPDGLSDLFVSCALTNEVLVFSGVAGTFIGVFVEGGAGGLVNPGTLSFQSGADGLELLVTSRSTLEVLRYDGLTGEFLNVFASFPSTLELSSIGDMQFGPDGDLYVTARSDSQTINGDENGAQVLRVDSETGEFIEVFIPPNAGGWSSAAPRVTFDEEGDLYVNNGNTNQILRFQGPLSSDPGAFSEVFVQGVGFILLTARDINSAGQIVGFGYPLGRRNITNRRAAYRYTPPAAGESVGRVDDLWVPGLNFQEDATAINNNGDVAGHFLSAATNRYHAFLWTAEEGFVDLGRLAGQDTYVTAINDRSGTSIQIAGYAKTSAGDRAWRYDTATGTMQNLGLISGSSGVSRGWDLNNLGNVVGVANAGSNRRAFRFSVSGGMTNLGAIGSGKHSEAFGMNDLGHIVGFTDTDSRASRNKPQAFLSTVANGMFALEPQITNLPSSMKLKIEPWRISNGARIIGPGTMGKSNVAYLITPQ